MAGSSRLAEVVLGCRVEDGVMAGASRSHRCKEVEDLKPQKKNLKRLGFSKTGIDFWIWQTIAPSRA